MRVLIIGATGFIGARLCLRAAECGCQVIALSRSGTCPQGASCGLAWSFGQPLPEPALQNIDCAIHLAHDFGGPAGAILTIEATIAAASQLHAAGVPRQLFFSSYSAGEHAVSIYGRTKFRIEQAFFEIPAAVIIRPGLVLGGGGIYGRISRWAQMLPVVPLPDGGHAKIAVIGIDKLCDVTLGMVTALSCPAEANLFELELTSLRELVLDAAAEMGRRPYVLPVPARLLTWVLKLATWSGIRLPVNRDNLDGLLANQLASHVSTMKADHVEKH